MAPASCPETSTRLDGINIATECLLDRQTGKGLQVCLRNALTPRVYARALILSNAASPSLEALPARLVGGGRPCVKTLAQPPAPPSPVEHLFHVLRAPRHIPSVASCR